MPKDARLKLIRAALDNARGELWGVLRGISDGPDIETTIEDTEAALKALDDLEREAVTMRLDYADDFVIEAVAAADADTSGLETNGHVNVIPIREGDGNG